LPTRQSTAATRRWCRSSRSILFCPFLSMAVANLCSRRNRHLRPQSRCRSPRTARRRYLRDRTCPFRKLFLRSSILFCLFLLMVVANLCSCRNRHLRSQDRCRSTGSARRRYFRDRTCRLTWTLFGRAVASHVQVVTRHGWRRSPSSGVGRSAVSVSSVVVTEDGTLWSCGYGHTGALGIPFPHVHIVPRRVGGSEMFGGHGVRMTSCGTCQTLILGTDNRMWACGHGYAGVLGLDEFTERSDLPVLVPNTLGFTNGAVMTVSVSESHSTAVMLDGSMYIWGRGLTTAPMLARPTGQVDGRLLWTPHQLNPNLFHGARIGHWHTWLDTHPDHAVAFAMGLHRRVGADTPPMANAPPATASRGQWHPSHYSFSSPSPFFSFFSLLPRQALGRASFLLAWTLQRWHSSHSSFLNVSTL